MAAPPRSAARPRRRRSACASTWTAARPKISTGVGFFDHMLELLARHGASRPRLEATGDLETGAHHTTEDVGICLGQAIDKALGDRAGIRRYGSALVPMDEALGECAIDISGRPFCAFDADLPDVTIAGFDAELTEEFFRAVSNNSKMTLHLWVAQARTPTT